MVPSAQRAVARIRDRVREAGRAGVAATTSGVEAVLADHAASCEVEGCRQLQHRIGPFVIGVHVDKVVLDAGAWGDDDRAYDELIGVEEALSAGTPQLLARARNVIARGTCSPSWELPR